MNPLWLAVAIASVTILEGLNELTVDIDSLDQNQIFATLAVFSSLFLIGFIWATERKKPRVFV